ncbi:hypothetical protein M378DRAFT_182096 [Amanita muscaria Koide BX008]|uniref:Uncharacterized protein n=1 Tax=Amanita muscaria (strain Koide BX008) TaxID=946122 RepID=A0A0C2RZZ6_AMAMK|nr:hypothetical protein M378DRAFT_182096 [Amanita muscaria Koide BX008]
MASRIARSIFSSAVRASARPTRAAQQLSRRHMSASESVHGSQHSGSDRPWIIGSALVFGPFFLYLLSPSARKSHAQHAIHNDKHDFGIHTSQHESPVSEVIMKDDEGTEANVTDSLAASEHEDAPKVGEAVEKEFSVSSSPDIENVKDSSEGEAKSEQPEPDATADADTSSAEKYDIVQEGVQVPPTNLDSPVAALEHETPKEQTEERREEKEGEEKQQDKKGEEA